MRYKLDFSRVSFKYRDLFEKIRGEHYTLDNFAYVYRGIWTGVLRIFVVDSEIIERFNIEKGALKPILRGKDIFPFYYRFNDKWVIYTNQPDFKDRFPNAIKYLEQYKTVLERRGAVWIHGRQWWELEDPLSPEWFELEKLVAPYTSNRNSFAYEEGKYYVMDSTIIVRFWKNEEERENYLKDFDYLLGEGFSKICNLDEARRLLKPSTENLFYLLGLLNSDLLEFFIKLYAPRVSKRQRKPPKGRFFLYIPPFPNVLPIAVGDEDTRREIVKLVREIMSLSIKIDELASREGDDENDGEYRDQLEELIEKRDILLGELNEIIFNLYGLGEEEKAVVQSFVLKKR